MNKQMIKKVKAILANAKAHVWDANEYTEEIKDIADDVILNYSLRISKIDLDAANQNMDTSTPENIASNLVNFKTMQKFRKLHGFVINASVQI